VCMNTYNIFLIMIQNIFQSGKLFGWVDQLAFDKCYAKGWLTSRT
jgi:hypothetical protein